jgi:hypothetical protein
MQTEQILWKKESGWSTQNASTMNGQANLVFAFGGIDVIASEDVLKELKSRYNNAHIIMASTAGEIHGNMVFDDSVSVTACSFEHTKLKVIKIAVGEFSSSFACGEAIRQQLASSDLSHILIFSDGISVNGDELGSRCESRATIWCRCDWRTCCRCGKVFQNICWS